MKTATVRELRNDYRQLLDRVVAGEEVVITKRGRTMARLVPERAEEGDTVDWSTSEAVRRDRSEERQLTAAESANVRQDGSGAW